MGKLKDNSHLARKPKYANGWLRSALEHAYTQQEWVDIFRGLPPVVQIKTLVDLQPKEIKQESANTLRLIIEGFKPPAAVQAHRVHELGPVHDQDSDDA